MKYLPTVFLEGWQRVRRHALINIFCGSALLLILVAQLLALLRFRNYDGLLILRYTREGIEQFGSVWQLLGYGIVGLVMVILNYRLAVELEERDWFWGKFVSGVTLLLAILLFLGFWAIITVN